MTPPTASRKPPPENPEEFARDYCLRILERRMHSRRELEVKIRRKGIDPEIAAPILDRFTEVGLVDDEAFARAFVASRQRRRPRGRRVLEGELAARGVDREIIARVLDALVEDEDPVEAAERALAPKLRGLASLDREAARRKASGFLLRRGFAYEVVRRVLSEHLP